MHPGQMILKKAMWFELVYMAVGFIGLLWAEIIAPLQEWHIEIGIIYFLLLCNHVDQMMLHYAMGSENKLSDSTLHSGHMMTKFIPCIAICVLLLILTVIAWVYISVSVEPASDWKNIDNTGAFLFWHTLETLRVVTQLQLAACALVQLIKMLDFYKHWTTVEEKEETESPTPKGLDA